MNAGQLSFIVAAVLLGSVISTLSAGTLMDWMGREYGESCFPPVDRKPGLYYEAQWRLEALPGVAHVCPVSLP